MTVSDSIIQRALESGSPVIQRNALSSFGEEGAR
jgi:hypothetical protein